MYEWRDHTAEVELHIEAPTAEDVFREAVAAFAELVNGEAADDGDEIERTIRLNASDHGSLLVHWVEELVYFADAQRFIPIRVASLQLGEAALDALVVGVTGSPRPLLKAVTYHGLEFSRRGDGWYARLVLDV